MNTINDSPNFFGSGAWRFPLRACQANGMGLGGVRRHSLPIFLMFGILFWSCETQIYPDLESTSPQLVVDAWLTAHPQQQTITLTQTQPYFDTQPLVAVNGASILVTNETDGRTFVFSAAAGGKYVWQPANALDSLGTVGDVFSLSVTVGPDVFMANSKIGRVPKIDSITFEYNEADAFLPEHYMGEFWARDPVGKGDAYWIKAWRNDTLLLRPSDINIAFDAGFSERGNFDGTDFILPIRQGISPFDELDNNKFRAPYLPGDSVYVEIHSLTVEAFNFLSAVIVQTDRPGGFAELFSTPIDNVSTNVKNQNPKGKKAVGFFNVGSVSGLGKKLVE